jgi:HSP20 family molecular chaperone IbpA
MKVETSNEMKVETPDESPMSERNETPQTPEDSESSESEGSRTPTNTRKKYEIKINQVADDVSLLRGKVQHLSEVAEKLDLSELAKDPKEGSKALKDLQKRCLEYTEHLMKNLLSLDEIIGSTSTRSQKKQQINTIQGLMADMDSVNERLKKFSQTLKSEEIEAEEAEREKKRKLLEEQEAKKKKIEEEKVQSSPVENKPTKTEDEDIEDEDEEGKGPHRIPEQVWKSLRLNPNLEAREYHDRYIIAGQLPGVRKQDINLDLSPNQTLVVYGARVPTEKEENLMRKHAHAAGARNPIVRRRIPVYTQEEEDRLVLEMAKGRYGTFRETYRLPGNIDKQRISASHEDGVLQIIIPKTRAPISRGPFYDDYDW